MIELRKVHTIALGRQVPYVVTYRIEGNAVHWSGSACFDGDWERSPGGVFRDVASGFEEIVVIGAMVAFIEQRFAGGLSAVA